MGDFVVATFNCASVRVRLDPILAWLSHHPVDALCLQETKVEDDGFPVMDFLGAGYHVVSLGRRGRNGVAIITREPVASVGRGFDDESDSAEARLIWAVVRGIPVVNTYVPQGGLADTPEFEYKLGWLDRLAGFFARRFSPQEPLLWCGDFNVAPQPMDVYAPDLLGNHTGFHPAARAALERIRDWGFVDVFRQCHPEAGHYTYWDYRMRGSLDRNLGWRIDHVWATPPLAERAAAAWIDLDARRALRPSDHTFLVAEFNL
jgi:exodeoxyribonuclease III